MRRCRQASAAAEPGRDPVERLHELPERERLSSTEDALRLPTWQRHSTFSRKAVKGITPNSETFQFVSPPLAFWSCVSAKFPKAMFGECFGRGGVFCTLRAHACKTEKSLFHRKNRMDSRFSQVCFSASSFGKLGAVRALCKTFVGRFWGSKSGQTGGNSGFCQSVSRPKAPGAPSIGTFCGPRRGPDRRSQPRLAFRQIGRGQPPGGDSARQGPLQRPDAGEKGPPEAIFQGRLAFCRWKQLLR